MARTPSIPPKLHGELLKKAGEGLGGPALAAWLVAAHGIRTSARAVQRFLASVAEDRQEVSQALYRENLAPEILADVGSSKEMHDNAAADEKVARDAAVAMEAGSLEWWRCMSIASAARNDRGRALALRAKLNGGDGESIGDPEAARSRMLAKLNALCGEPSTLPRDDK